MTLRRSIIAFLGLAAIAVVVAVAVVSRNRDDAPAELRVREGKVALTRGTSPAVLADEGEDLRSGDVLRTNGNGRAQIDFFDDSLARLDADTELTLRTIEDTEAGRKVDVAVKEGRIWHRVANRESGPYTVDIGKAEVKAAGTTFLTDCRRAPTCYVLGFEGDAEVSSDASSSFTVGPGGCVKADGVGHLEDCNETRLGLIDEWVRENLAEDQQLELDRIESPTPSTTPSSTPDGSARTFTPSRQAPPTPVPTAAPTAEPTDEPTPKPGTRTFPPHRTFPPRPTDPTPIDRTPKPTPF
jgi:hypothetical protein